MTLLVSNALPGLKLALEINKATYSIPALPMASVGHEKSEVTSGVVFVHVAVIIHS